MIRQSADNLRLVFTVNKRVNKTADDSAVTGHPWGLVVYAIWLHPLVLLPLSMER